MSKPLPEVRLRIVGQDNPSNPALEPIKTYDLRNALVEEFLASADLKPSSRKTYAQELKRFLEWTDERFISLTPRLLGQYKTYLETECLNPKGQKLKPTSINKAITAIKSFVGWVSEAYPEKIGNNVAASIKLISTPPLEAKDLSDEEVNQIASAVTRSPNLERDLALFAVLMHGLRASEVVALNVGDWDGTRLHIRQAKAGSIGTVPLLPGANSRIRDYLDSRRDAGESLQSSSPLFIVHAYHNAGNRLSYEGLYKLVKKWGKDSGISNLTPHRFRHTYATNLMLAGIDSLHARTLTRHKSEASFRRYTQRAMSEAAEQAFYRVMKMENEED